MGITRISAAVVALCVCATAQADDAAEAAVLHAEGLMQELDGDSAGALESFREAIETREPDADFVLQMGIKANVFDHPTLEEDEFVEIRRQLGIQQ